MTDTQRLKLISYLVESDAGFESDCVMVDVLQGRKVSNSEKVLAKLVGDIYKIVHPRFSSCKHEDWERESEEMLKIIKYMTKEEKLESLFQYEDSSGNCSCNKYDVEKFIKQSLQEQRQSILEEIDRVIEQHIVKSQPLCEQNILLKLIKAKLLKH